MKILFIILLRGIYMVNILSRTISDQLFNILYTIMDLSATPIDSENEEGFLTDYKEEDLQIGIDYFRDFLFNNSIEDFQHNILKIHLLLFNYEVALNNPEDELNEWGYVDLVENNSIDSLLHLVTQSDQMQIILCNHYIDVADDEELLNEYDNSEDGKNIQSFIEWINTQDSDVITIGEKFKYTLFDLVNLFVSCELSYSDSIDLSLNLFNQKMQKDDFLSIYIDWEDFNLYQKEFIEMIYLESYTYLLIKKDTIGTTFEEDFIIANIEYRQQNHNFDYLPENEYYQRIIIEAFISYNLNKEQLNKKYHSIQEDIMKRCKKKISLISLIDFYA